MLDCQVKDDPPVSSSNKPPPKQRTKLIGFSEHMRIARVRQETKTGPDPWAVRKFAVGLVIGIYFYSYYVFIVRVCVKMVRMTDPSRLGNRAQGIAYLVIFHLLFVMFVWSYYMAITTPPGFAKDHVPQTEPPPEDVELVSVVGYRFENTAQSPRQHTPELNEADDDVDWSRPGEEAGVTTEAQVVDKNREEEELAEAHPIAGAFGPAIANAASAIRSPHSSSTSEEDAIVYRTHTPGASASGTTIVSSGETFPVTFPPKSHHQPKHSSSISSPPRRSQSTTRSYLDFPPPPTDYEPAKPRLLADRIPARVPILTENYRYDAREGFLRPYRSHRCKHCAAVVLKMDHHCPWVGTCVGARNYKYFYNFLQWSTSYTIFVFITLIIANTLPLASPTRSHPGLDAQQIVIIAIAGFFSLFTGALFTAHTRLIIINMTTIEEMAMGRMKQRERSALARVHGFWGFRAQMRTRAEWNEQWGRLGKEGNLWWLGSSRANWEMVMGKEKLGWFLPIPARPTPDDGLSYVPNPRFSKEGYWLERKDWPKEVR